MHWNGWFQRTFYHAHMASNLPILDKTEFFQRANHVRTRPIPWDFHPRLSVCESRFLVKIETRLGSPPLVPFVEMAEDQLPNHLNQFLHRPAMRCHFRLMANGNQQSIFSADIEIKFHKCDQFGSGLPAGINLRGRK